MPTTSTTAPSFKTLTARYAGTCRRCSGPIVPGQTIRYGGKGRTYHLAADCAQGAPVAAQAAVPAAQATVAPAAADLMSAALAQTIRQTFAELMARPARLADPGDEPIDVEAVEAAPVAAAVEAPAAAVTALGVPVPAWNDWQALPAFIGQTQAAAAAAAQTPAAARQATLRRPIAGRPVAEAAPAADWF